MYKNLKKKDTRSIYLTIRLIDYYYDVAVKHINHNATSTSPKTFLWLP